MEELIAQLLQQSAVQTKVQSDAQHAATMEALAPARKTTLGPKGRNAEFTPGQGLPPQTQMPAGRPGPSVRGASVGPGDDVGMRVDPTDNMPVFSREAVGQNMNDMAAHREAGRPVPEWMYQGMPLHDAVQSQGIGMASGAMGGDRIFTETLTPAAQTHLLPYKAPPTDEQVRQQKGHLVEDFRKQTGRIPHQLFEGKSTPDAIQMVIDQQHALREDAGDRSAWWSAFAMPGV